MDKTLEYYMGLDYTVKINALPAQYGGGYVAMIPMLASADVTGWGETRQGAVSALEKNKATELARRLAEGEYIPEPSDDGYGGDFNVTLSAPLHRKISEYAAGEGTDLCDAIVKLLMTALGDV